LIEVFVFFLSECAGLRDRFIRRKILRTKRDLCGQ
jgi:hypothetical protein